MADNKTPASDNTRNSATEDLFNREATARVNPNRKMTDDIFGREQSGSEELFKQNIQGRIDHEMTDDLLPEIESEGFSFVVNPQLLDALTSEGVLSSGTELAMLSVPVEGGDFSFSLDDSQFRIDGDRLVLASDLSLQADTDFQLNVQVNSNSSAFSIDVPVTINFDNLADFAEEVVNQAPVDIELSDYNFDENASAGDVVATIAAIDNDNAFGFSYELTGEGADKFEIVGNQLVIKGGVVFDFETQSQHTVEITVTDPSNNQFTEQIVIDLNDINEAPVLSDEVFSVAEGAAVTTGELDATDQDFNDQLTFMVADGFSLPPGFILESDGDYSFDPADSAYDHLAVGDSQVITIPIRVVDSGGLESSAQIQLTVQGTNDAPVADANIVAAVDEGASQIGGQLTASDVDDGASLLFSITSGATAPDGFVLNSDGSYSFNPQDAAYEGMDAGDTQVLTIPVTVTDEHGATDTQQIQITVTGTNDTPVAGSDVTASVNEGDAAISGQLTATDADDSASLSFSITSGSSAPDGFTLNSDGSYSFNPQDAAYEGMDAGDTQVLTIPVTVTDEHGATDTQQIQITVTGTNDTPVAGSDVTASVNEGDAAISGQLTATDADDSASLSFSITSGSSAPDGFTLNSDGSYSFNPQDSAYEGMDAGDTQVLTIPVTVTDEHGATDTQQIQITVTGTNDTPVAGSDVTASVNEGDAAISGQLTATDADDSASLSFSITSGSSAPDGFTLNSDGSYSFNPQDAAYEGMDAGDTQVLTIPVTVTDEHGATDTQQIQITVTGTNDTPVAGSDVTASVNEGDAAISGQLTATDADDSASLSFSITSGSSAPDGFVLNSDGSYSFNPQDSAYEGMDAGDTQVLTIPVTVTDEHGATDTQQIQITVTGTNDTPVAGSDVTASVNEGDAAISGQLTATDADDSASLSFSITSGSSAPDGFVLNSDGSYSFNPQDSAYEGMDAGDTQVLTIPVTVTDEHGATDTQQIQITVTGTNDTPVAGSDVTASVNEGDAAISGQLTATDADDSASLSFSITSGSSAPDGFVLNSDGSYSFNPQDAAYEGMDAGDTQVLTIPVTVTDEHGATDTQQIQITVTGTNDTPVAGSDVTASVNEGDAAISGQLTATDADDSASLSFSITSGSSAPDGFTLNSDGSYSFNPQDSAYEGMDAGDTQVLTIPVTVTDEHGATDTQQIQITVTGTNDTPVAGSDVTASVNEGDAAISGQLTATDADDSASLSFSITSGSSAPDGFVLNSDGSYSFNPQDSAYEGMDAGDTQVLTIPVTVTDEHGATDMQQIQITVTGTNDTPVAGSDVTASVNEGDAAISGQLTATDADDSASLSFSITSGSSAPDGFVLNSDGSYSFNPQDSAYEGMDAGDTQVLTIPVTVTDEHGATDTQQIQITVTGTNDTPVAGSDVTASVNEGDAAISGQLTATDADDSASLSFSITSGSSAPDGFVLNSDGSYSFNPQNAAYEGMDAGDTQVLTIPVTVTDEHGATDTQQIQITVTGTNDTPVAGSDVTASVNEGDAAISGQLTATDADDSASLSFSITSGSSAPDGFTLNSDGSYSFNPQDSAYEGMDAGDTQVLTIPVTVTDEHGATDTQQIQITVTGTNDTPVAGSDVTASVNEGDAAISGQLTATDADDSASLSFSITSGSSAPDGFTLNSDGSYSFNPQDAAYEGMDAGDTQVLTIPVTVTDEHGATDTQQIQITVTGTNDTPVAGSDVTASVNEGDAAISGQLTATDADDSASLSFSITSGSSAPDGFVLNSDGSYSFNPQDSAYEGMDAGDTQVLTIPVTVTDEHGATDTQQIQITVTGTNDTPVAGSDVTASVNEGDAAISGQLTATDADDSASLSFSITSGSSAPDGFVLNSDGSYSFNPQDAAYEDMDAGDTQVLTIPVTVTDEHGATDTQQIQITVTGTNDTPVAGSDVTASVNEGDAAISGQLTATDADDSASLSFSITSGSSAPDGFTLNSDGSYSFNPQDAAYEGMDAGDTQVLTVPVTVTDEHGATDTQQIQITVTGTNDTPVAGSDVTASVNEGDAAISGQLTATDADDSASLSFSITTGSSAPDGFTLNSDGSYSFDPQDSAYDSMSVGDSQTFTIPVTVTDEYGATVSQQIAITINGTNDAPTVVSLSSSAIAENSAGAVIGNVSTTDVDSTDTHTYTVSDNRFEIVDDGNGNTQLKLKDGVALDHEAENGTVTLTVTTDDGKGVSYSENFTVSVADINDGPTDISLSASSVAENVAGAVVGNLTTADQDSADTHSYTVSDNRFEVVDDGSGNQQLKLKAGVALDHETDDNLSVTVTTDDGNGGSYSESFTISVADGNDSPTDISVSGSSRTVAITNAGFESTSLADNGHVTGSPDGWTLNASRGGTWDPQTGGLSVPEGENIAFVDHAGGTLSQTLSESLSADTDLNLSVKVGVSDLGGTPAGYEVRLYAGNTLLKSVDESDFAVQHAQFTDVSLNLSAQELQAFSDQYGEALRIELVADNTGDNVYFDDVKLDVASYSNTGEVDENSAGAVIGNLQTEDQDGSDSHSYTVSDSRFEVVDDGNGTRQLKLKDGIALDSEAEGGSVAVAVTTSDGNGGSYTETLTVNVNDINDGPTDISLSASSINENAAGAVVGNVTTADQDSGDTHTYTVSDNRFEIVDDGSGNKQLKLKDGVALDSEAENGSVSVTVTTTDSGGASYNEAFSISVADLNEGPTDIILSGSSVNENAAGAVVGNVTTADQDSGDTHTYTVSDNRFEIVDDGSGNKQLKLKDGVALDSEAENGSVSVTVTTTDSGGASYNEAFSISVADLNEGPTDISLSGSSVNENAAGAVVGNVTTADQDSGDTHTYTVSDNRFEIVDDGSGNKQLKLKDGVVLDSEAENGSVSVTVTTTDSSGASYNEAFSISVADVNEGPTDISLSGNTVAENVAGAVVGNLTATDQDSGDSHTYTVSDNRFEVVDDGSGNKQLKLKDGISLDHETEDGDVSVTVTVSDGNGGSYSEAMTVNISDVNEAVSGINVSGTQTVQESLQYRADYLAPGHSNPAGKTVAELQAVDGDDADSHTYSIVSATDNNGNPVTIDSSFPFEVQGNKVVVKSSATLDHETVPRYNIVVQAEDSAGHTATETVSVDVTDYETVYGGISTNQSAQGSSEEDTMRGAGGDDVLSGRDGDDRIYGDADNDTLTGGAGDDYIDGGSGTDVAVFSGNHADYTITHNGGSNYTIADNRAGSPDGTDTVVNVETFRFADGDVPVGSLLNVAPVAGADITQTVAEDSSVVNGQLNATDANGDTLTYSITSGSSAPDGFTLNSNGSYSFDPADAAYNQLAAGETQVLTIPVTVTDGNGGSDTQNIQITVQGTSDVNAPNLVTSLGVAQRSVVDDTRDQDIDGTRNTESLIGGSGNDNINLGTDGEDYAQGGAGDDIITGADSSSDNTDDRIDGGAGNDTLISSNASGDLLIGGAGNDTASGQGGNDLYVMEIGGGQDTFHGGSGMDQVLLMGPNGQITDINDITITMTNGSYSVNNGVVEFSSGATGSVTLSDGSELNFDGVEKLQLNEHFQYDDNWENVFVAQSDGDTLTGNVTGDGNYFGSVGDDVITGMSNEDYVSAGAGDDVINTGADEDIVVAGSGDDTVNTGSHNDLLIGGAGDDTMDGGSGTDTAVFDGNRDQYMVTRNSDGSYQVKDLVAGRDGTDTISSVERFQFADQTVSSGSLLSTNPSNSQAVGSETVFDLDISASMVNADASDSISAITITGLPDGVTLSNGTENADGSWTVQQYELDGLNVRVPDSVTSDFSLNVSVTATDSSANEQAVSMQAVQIELPDNHGSSSSSSSSSGGSFNPQNATLLAEQNFDSGTPSGINGSVSSVSGGQVGSAAQINDASFDIDNLNLDSSSGAKTTVSMWVQADPDGGWEALVGSDRYTLFMKDGNLGFNTWSSDIYGVDAGAIDDGQMHHIVAVFTNGDVSQNEIYIDGVQQNLTQIQGSPNNSRANIDSDNGELHIGRAGADSSGRYDFTGQVDEVKIYDGELSASDVSDLYGLESQGKEWDTPAPAPTPAPVADADSQAAAELNVMQGSDGNDQLTGGDGDDKLIGGEGNDTLTGGAGDDILQGGKGNDTAVGGEGSDTYVFNPFDGNDSFSGGTGGGWTDVIQLSTDGSSDPGDPWTITVNGQEMDYDLAAQALELNPDTSGVVTMADGSELTFEGIEKIEW